MAYVATINTPGYLPEGDPAEFDTAREAWSYLLSELESGEGELAWQPDDPSDPNGPRSRTATALEIERMAERDRPGTVYGPSGYGDDAPMHDLGLAYSVTLAEQE